MVAVLNGGFVYVLLRILALLEKIRVKASAKLQIGSEIRREGDRHSAWVHAYLHRKEGDLSNARYWYRRAQQPASTASVAEEWQQIAQALLTQP